MTPYPDTPDELDGHLVVDCTTRSGLNRPARPRLFWLTLCLTLTTWAALIYHTFRGAF